MNSIFLFAYESRVKDQVDALGSGGDATDVVPPRVPREPLYKPGQLSSILSQDPKANRANLKTVISVEEDYRYDMNHPQRGHFIIFNHEVSKMNTCSHFQRSKKVFFPLPIARHYYSSVLFLFIPTVLRHWDFSVDYKNALLFQNITRCFSLCLVLNQFKKNNFMITQVLNIKGDHKREIS